MIKPPPGYTRLVPLDRERHRGLAAPATGAAAFAAKLNSIALLASELIPAARHYPVVFVRDGESGRTAVVAVTGLDERNAFVDGAGEWRAEHYVPAYVRRWPFASVPVKRDGADEPERLVCVDEAALALSEDPYFDAEGAATPRWERHEKLIKAFDTGLAQTVALCARVDELELLETFEAHAHLPGRDPVRLQGLLRVSEARLNELPAKDIRRMMREGQLSRLYAHLMSLDNFRLLAGATGQD